MTAISGGQGGGFVAACKFKDKGKGKGKGKAKGKQPCRFFFKGACYKGEACTYSHVAEGTQGEAPVKPAGDESAKPCWHFQNKGSCKYGDKCKKLHSQQPLVPVPKAKAKAKAKAAAAAAAAAAKVE